VAETKAKQMEKILGQKEKDWDQKEKEHVEKEKGLQEQGVLFSVYMRRGEVASFTPPSSSSTSSLTTVPWCVERAHKDMARFTWRVCALHTLVE